MASRFWVGGSGTWDASSTTHWAATSGGSSGASVPTSADTVTIDSNSGGTFTITLGANTASAPVTITNGTVTLSSSGFTCTGTLTINGSSASLTLADAAIIANIFTLTSGTFSSNSKSLTLFTFSSNNSNVRTLTISNSTVTVTGTSSAWTCTTSTNMVVNASGSSISFPNSNSSTSVNFQGGSSSSIHWNNVTIPMGSISGVASYDGTVSVGAAFNFTTSCAGSTFNNLTVTTTDTTQPNFFVLQADITVTGTLTLTGNRAAPDRLLLITNTLGTRRTITNSGATMVWSNLNISDIGLTSAYDASAITGGCGDLGNNNNITFTPAKNLYWYQNTGNWTDSTKWFSGTGGVNSNGSSRIPLPQDTAYFDANSLSTNGQTITINGVMTGAIDWTGVTKTVTSSTSGMLLICGSYIATSNVTVSNSGYYQFYGTAAKTVTIPNGSIRNFQTGGTGAITLGSALTVTGVMTLLNFDAAGYAVSVSGGSTSTLNAPAIPHTITLGSGTWTFTAPNVAVWDATQKTNLTLDSTGNTMIIADTGTTTKSFFGNSLTYNNLQITGGGTGQVTMTGSNTFSTVQIGAPKTVVLTSGTTQTLSTLTATGSSGNVITLKSTTTSNATLSKASGTVSCDWLSLQHVATSGIPATSWYAGANSTNVSGDETTWWTFSSPGGSSYSQTLSAVMSTMAGTISRLTFHSITASTSSYTGSITRSTSKAIPATTSAPAASITKEAQKTITSQMSTMAGSLASIRAVLITLAAQMAAMSGAVVKRTSHSIAAQTASFTGSVQKNVATTITAATSAFSGSIGKGVDKILDAVSSGFTVVFRGFIPLVWQPLRERIMRVPRDGRLFKIRRKSGITVKRDGRQEKP